MCEGIAAVVWLSGTFDVPMRPTDVDASEEFVVSNVRRGIQAVVLAFLGMYFPSRAYSGVE